MSHPTFPGALLPQPNTSGPKQPALCFHILTHSCASRFLLSLVFSITSTLFGQNVGVGVPPSFPPRLFSGVQLFCYIVFTVLQETSSFWFFARRPFRTK